MRNLTKKQCVRFVFVLLALSLLFGCLISLIGVSNYSATYINQNLYSNASFDFIIPSPSKTQMDDLKSKNFITDVCPYYTTTIKVNINSKYIETCTYFVDDVDDLIYSPFCDDRIISAKDVKNNALALVDYVFSQKNGVSIGDSIVVNEKDYIVGKICKPNSLTADGCLVICWDDELKSSLNATDSNYSGAWVKSSAVAECDDYLKSYIPEGRIRKQGINETAEQYQEYLANFYKTDFYKEVTNISSNKQISDAKIEAAQKLIITEQIIAGILIMLSIFVGLYYVYFSGKQKSRLKKAIQANTNNYPLLKKTVYCKSVFLPLMVYCIVLLVVVCFKYLLGSFIDGILLSNAMIIWGVMLSVTCIGLLLICKVLVDKNYKIIKIKEDNKG